MTERDWSSSASPGKYASHDRVVDPLDAYLTQFVGLDDLVIDDTIEPSQLDGAVVVGRGTRQLMLGLLEDAVRVIEHGPINRRYPGIYEETMAWLDADEPDYCFSFVMVCGVLGLNPSRVRGRLAKAIAAREQKVIPRRGPSWELAAHPSVSEPPQAAVL